MGHAVIGRRRDRIDQPTQSSTPFPEPERDREVNLRRCYAPDVYPKVTNSAPYPFAIFRYRMPPRLR